MGRIPLSCCCCCCCCCCFHLLKNCLKKTNFVLFFVFTTPLSHSLLSSERLHSKPASPRELKSDTLHKSYKLELDTSKGKHIFEEKKIWVSATSTTCQTSPSRASRSIRKSAPQSRLLLNLSKKRKICHRASLCGAKSWLFRGIIGLHKHLWSQREICSIGSFITGNYAIESGLFYFFLPPPPTHTIWASILHTLFFDLLFPLISMFY